MALFRSRVWFLSALVVLAGTATLTRAEEDGPPVATAENIQTEVEDPTYQRPVADPKKTYVAEHFDNLYTFNKRWVLSEAEKQDDTDEHVVKYDGKWEVTTPMKRLLKGDLGLVLVSEAKHGAISTLLDRPFEFKDKPLVVQYEVTMQEGQNCGGAYIKLLSRGTNTKADLVKFHDQTPYTIMFGPDKCGSDNKLHFIFRHKNPKTGDFEEKHAKKPTQRLEDIYNDKLPHLYTLILRPDNTFTILIDQKEVNSGSLLTDMTPPVNPPEEIDDPNDSKPDDWDDREKIVDPSVEKPGDWDESAPAEVDDPHAVRPDGWLSDEPDMIPDPAAEKPADWDDDMDGSWEAPLIDNPLCAQAPGCGEWTPPKIPNPQYKGKWRAPLIPNPNYKGKWTPRRVRNPDYFSDDQPFRMTPITAVGFELWSMSASLLFDNIIVTDDPAEADRWADLTYALKKAKIATQAESVIDAIIRYLSDNPWMNAVLVFGVFFIVAGTAYYCCKPKAAEDYKKTDGYTEDDPQEEPEWEPEVDADAPEPGEETEPEKAEKPEKVEKPSKHQLEKPAEEPDSTDTTPLVDTEAAGDGQRKRKPRKE